LRFLQSPREKQDAERNSFPWKKKKKETEQKRGKRPQKKKRREQFTTTTNAESLNGC
jgi:hypothetical protein